MSTFRRLIAVTLCSGALAGVILSAIQHFTVVPLIEAAERYETEDEHHGAEWKPETGRERTGWTVVTTVLTGIGFAALLFGFLGLSGRKITIKNGVLWGLAAFACFHLAPSLGLPPMPPGVPVSDVQSRQLWWTCAVLSAAAALWLMTRRKWMQRIAGVVVLAAPHLVGVTAVVGDNAVPPELMRNFAAASLASVAIFWILVGGIGGYLSSRWSD
ncbi:MAG: CbtA family protein [Bryobacterales bacterium]|nr:CbtA family protein [Bryobacterales bacterium]